MACSRKSSGPHLLAFVRFVDKDGAAFEQVAVAFDDKVQGGVKERMAGTNEGGQRFAGDADKLLLEGDAFVAGQHGLAVADLAVAVADDGRHMLDLVAFRLALVDGPAQEAKGFEEKGSDEMRLEPPRFSPFHVLADLPDLGHVHRIARQGAFLDQLAQVPAIGVISRMVPWCRVRARMPSSRTQPRRYNKRNGCCASAACERCVCMATIRRRRHLYVRCARRYSHKESSSVSSNAIEIGTTSRVENPCPVPFPRVR